MTLNEDVPSFLDGAPDPCNGLLRLFLRNLSATNDAIVVVSNNQTPDPMVTDLGFFLGVPICGPHQLPALWIRACRIGKVVLHEGRIGLAVLVRFHILQRALPQLETMIKLINNERAPFARTIVVQIPDVSVGISAATGAPDPLPMFVASHPYGVPFRALN